MKDDLSQKMAQAAIRISEERLGKSLTKTQIENITKGNWSYMGLEMIIDTVSTISLEDIEPYLIRLGNKTP